LMKHYPEWILQLQTVEVRFVGAWTVNRVVLDNHIDTWFWWYEWV